MKLVVFGANGGSGKRVVESALAGGHDVVAAVRSPEKVAAKDKLRAVKADVLDRASVIAALDGADAVVSTFGPADNKNPGTLMSDGIANLVAACEERGVQRFVFESGLMVGERDGLSLVSRIGVAVYGWMNSKLRADKERAEGTIRASKLSEWVIVRPPSLDDSPAKGDYVFGERAAVSAAKTMSHADVAAFLLRCATEAEFAKTTQRVGHR
ncbi:MAG TPA: NAD(P)H-binding protein [Polyangiaceae bacterium]